jgi:hypothetical protein
MSQCDFSFSLMFLKCIYSDRFYVWILCMINCRICTLFINYLIVTKLFTTFVVTNTPETILVYEDLGNWVCLLGLWSEVFMLSHSLLLLSALSFVHNKFVQLLNSRRIIHEYLNTFIIHGKDYSSEVCE